MDSMGRGAIIRLAIGVGWFCRIISYGPYNLMEDPHSLLFVRFKSADLSSLFIISGWETS